MTNALILHGTYSSPEQNWFPWLKRELEQLKIIALAPQFPTPEKQTVDNWINIMDKNISEYNKDTILIGHSSAPLVICAKLEKLDKPLRAVFFVAPFLGFIGNKEYDTANSNFVKYPFDWNQVKQGSRKFYIYRSNNDPYVPENIGRKVSQNLGVEEIIIPQGGHLNSESGYDTFPRLLADIRQL